MSDQMKVKKAYAIAIGNLPMPWQVRATKMAREVIEIIKSLDGFIGVNPCPPHGTLVIFHTLNQAKEAKNILIMKGVTVGYNITKVEIPLEEKNDI